MNQKIDQKFYFSGLIDLKVGLGGNKKKFIAMSGRDYYQAYKILKMASWASSIMI